MSTATSLSSAPVLLLVQGAEQRRVEIKHTPFTIGRKTDRDLPIPDSRISRQHASIVAENGRYFIVDGGGRTGVYVNRVRAERHELSPNDRCDFGVEDVYLVFNPTAPIAAHGGSAAEFLSMVSMAPRSSEAGSELQQLRLFLEAARKLNTSGLLSDVIATLLDCSVRLTHAERGFVFLRGVEGKLYLGAGRNSRGEMLRDDSTISHSLLQQAADSGSEFIAGDTSASADLAGRASIMAHDLRTVIAIPLRRTGASAGTGKAAPSKLHPVLGVLYLDSRIVSRNLAGVSQEILHAIAKEAAGLLENARLVEAEEVSKRYQQELSIAARIQQRLMSVRIPDVPFAEVQGRNLPCHEVGGDFFDVVRTPDSVSVVLTDVSGKGVSAALLGSVIQGMIYSQLAQGISVESAVAAAHNFLCEKDVGEKYATMVVARLWANGELELLNCGHVPPRLVSGGKVTEPDNVNPPIGLLPDVSFRSMRLQLKPGDRLLLTTDGVVEAENAAGDFFGYERLDDAATAAGFEGVFRAVQEFCGSCPLQDDCTVVELVYAAAKAAGTV